ncbi:SHOCT domain-containing protein (plasmid) [Halorussus limi]|uniref:SHOCT domain-containing protein n=1 Tax=Halorussus limi TaxID=2938695 RepID=A0A8U0I1N2_9EURY|nr:SHOCT domain-containing protein [Halorussus limi]UPV76943.1 SHOCT domain-containing protein [Halorussus limi]
MAWVFVDRKLLSQTRSYGSNSGATANKQKALDTLKQQYAVGEIDEAEFERRLETLLENESIADVENRTDVNSDTASETQPIEEGTTKQGPHHRQTCHRRGKHHRGRH